jgi:hypothetical protein
VLFCHYAVQMANQRGAQVARTGPLNTQAHVTHLYLMPLTVRMTPSCSWRVAGWRAHTSCPTYRGRGISGGTSPPNPTSSYLALTPSLQ